MSKIAQSIAGLIWTLSVAWHLRHDLQYSIFKVRQSKPSKVYFLAFLCYICVGDFGELFKFPFIS